MRNKPTLRTAVTGEGEFSPSPLYSSKENLV